MTTRESPDRKRPPPGVRRRQILEQASRLFEARGYYATSMEDISDAVGLRKSSIYHHFPTKDEIVVELHQEFTLWLLDALAVHEATTDDPTELLREVAGDIFQLVAEQGGHVRLFLEQFRSLPDAFQSPIIELRDQYQTRIEEIVSRGRDLGQFDVESPRLATLALLGICNWSYQWYQPDGGSDPRALASRFVHMFLAGIAARPS